MVTTPVVLGKWFKVDDGDDDIDAVASKSSNEVLAMSLATATEAESLTAEWLQDEDATECEDRLLLTLDESSTMLLELEC